MLEELINEIIKRIESVESRMRTRSESAQKNFEHAVATLIYDAWRSVSSVPISECLMNKRSGFYSENPRYRDPMLTYPQTMAAYDGLLALGLIEETSRGHFDPETLEGKITRFIARDELIERLRDLDGHPAFDIPSSSSETIILRDKVNGKRVQLEYDDTATTDRYRSSLDKINQCFLKHWCDLELLDSELPILQDRITKHKTKEPIDFSKRTLVRIFNNGSFKEGGRFYRGWWQNVPSEYRKYITIDEKRTAEVDFSQLNPHLLYAANYKELGSEDAYSRVLDGAHRDIVKQAFNAMVQNKGPLNNCPKDINLDDLDMGWIDLRDKIIEAHKPISDQFFIGIGNKLQFKDSCIAEGVMLDFAAMDAPALPVHDSFILHHAYAERGEIEEVMRRSYYAVVGEHISKVDTEILTWTYRKTEEQSSNSDLNTILDADNDVSQWRKRHDLWYTRRYRGGP